ncbi:LysR family transcriptional regulator [Rhodobacteraceae bacterium F11138]|nr:LysR family transcriptional regulator [Rhodobacteraceae bacterium F11138]
MDTRFLESLVIISASGSIAEAARRQNLTPAAVAQRIARLEAEIGQPLIMREGRSSQLTQAGLAILPHARTMIRNARELESIAGGDAPAGQLRLGATATALTGQIPGIVAGLRQRHPQLDYFLQPGSSVDLYHSALSGDLDAAVIMQPPFTLPKMLHWRTLRTESFVLLSPGDWPPVQGPGALNDRPFIRYDRNQWGGQIIDRYLRSEEIAVRDLLELDALDSIAALVSRGLGMAIVPDWAPPWPEGLAIRKLALPAIGQRKIGVLWRQSAPNLRNIRAFLDVCDTLYPAGG